MGFFNRPTLWEINALIIISAQLHDIQHRLDVLIAASPRVTQAQLDALATKLGKPTQSLAEAIEKAKTKG